MKEVDLQVCYQYFTEKREQAVASALVCLGAGDSAPETISDCVKAIGGLRRIAKALWDVGVFDCDDYNQVSDDLGEYATEAEETLTDVAENLLGKRASK